MSFDDPCVLLMITLDMTQTQSLQAFLLPPSEAAIKNSQLFIVR